MHFCIDEQKVLQTILDEIKFKGHMLKNQRFDRDDVLFVGASPRFELWDECDMLPQYHIILHTGPDAITGLKSTWVAEVSKYESKGDLFAEGLYLTQEIKDIIYAKNN